MSQQIAFKGSFELRDSTGKNPEIKESIDVSFPIDDMVYHILTIPANTEDFQVAFGGVARAKAIYMTSNQQISVRFEDASSTPIKQGIDASTPNATVIVGEITAMYITTTASEATVKILIAGVNP